MFKSFVLLVIVAASSGGCKITPNCTQKEMSQSYLDMAVYMITKARNILPPDENCDEHALKKAMDCSELFLTGFTKSGVYQIWPANRKTEGKSLDVFCDMETDGGGWTVLQRRGDFQRPVDYFYKDWKSYKEGFGDLERDFWLGNDNTFALSNQKQYSVRFDLKDVEGNKRFAVYDQFWIDDENHKYMLHISDYRGDAGDSMIESHNGQMFSTKDQDNDRQKEQNCAQIYKGGWWYNACHSSNLNGLYLKGKHESYADGVNWFFWKGHHESLEWTEIKIRPKTFRHTSTMTPM